MSRHVAAGLGALLACLAIAADGASAQTWTTQVVEDNAYTLGTYIAHAYNPVSGRPGVAYTQSTGKATTVRFAEWNGSQWAPGSVGSGGAGLDLAYSPAGVPSLSYLSGTNLVFAEKSGTRWTLQTVDVKAGDVTSLAFDVAGNPAIAYTQTSGKSKVLKLARRTGTTWSLQQVDGPLGVRFTSLAFDPSGFPAIAYSVDQNGDVAPDTLKYASWTGAAWAKETVESGSPYYGGDCDLAFDPLTGAPAIAHRGSTTRGARYVERVGGGWSASEVDPCPYCGSSPTLAFDAAGIPWVGYKVTDANMTFVEITAAHWDEATASWLTEVADGTHAGAYPALAIGPAGQMSFAFQGGVPGSNPVLFAFRP